MKLVPYVCSHCGRKFEAEEKDIVECPGCFWTSSVKREDDIAEPVSKIAGSQSKKPALSFKLPKMPALPWKPITIAGVSILGIFLLVKIVAPVLGHLGQGIKKVSQKSDKKEEASKGAPVEKLQGSPKTEVNGLSLEDQNILNRRVQLSADRAPNEEEQKILANRASFKSGFSEKLPSQAWTLENFKEMVAQQEKFYQVTLPRSYKNSLYDLFKTKYIPGADAFKAGDLIQARNNWVESLGFPIYANNPQKHRGVALTMLRPFINDTLSKIGTINSAVVEKGVREKEQGVAEAYEKLFSLIEQKSWLAALEAIRDLNQKLDAFSNPTHMTGGPSEYPQGLSKVDPDIQQTLNTLLTVPPPAISDLEPMQVDAARKKRVIEGFIPEQLQTRQQKYDEGMDAIKHGDWAGAEKAFKEVDLPDELSKDAMEKVKILKKLNKTGPIPPAPTSGPRKLI